MDSKAKEGEVVTRKVGRPTKVTPELIATAWEYLNNTTNVSRGQLLPTIEGLALATGVSRDTLHEWANDSTNEFSDIVRELRSAQAEKLIQNALIGNYNPSIAKLLLSKHGYVERTEQDVKVEAVQPILGAKAKEVIDVHSHDDDSQVVEATQED